MKPKQAESLNICLFSRQKLNQEASEETSRPKRTKRPQPDPAENENHTPKKKRNEQENPSKENQPPKKKKKKKMALMSEEDSGVMSEQSAELPGVDSFSKEGKKKKKKAVVAVSSDVPVKKKSKTPHVQTLVTFECGHES